MNRQIVSSLRVVRIQEDYEFTIYSVPSREEETGTRTLSDHSPLILAKEVQIITKNRFNKKLWLKHEAAKETPYY
jgi:hypothetical protein